VVVGPCKTLLWCLDDLLTLTHEFSTTGPPAPASTAACGATASRALKTFTPKEEAPKTLSKGFQDHVL
jgi:hypothetical protein